MGLICVCLSACSKAHENLNDNISQEIGISIADNSRYENEKAGKLEVFFVEPVKTVDQIASDAEQQNILQILSKLDSKDFMNAVVYEPSNVKTLVEHQVMLLFQSEKNDIQIYGYYCTEYGFRGIISCLNDEYSYYDIIWRSKVGELKFYEQDFDNDDMSEIAFCFEGAMGTGVENFRLVIFDDVMESGKLVAYEFTSDMQLEQFENKIQFVVDEHTKEINILKSGENVGIIDWKKFANNTENNYIGIDCLNQKTFEINEEGINMCVGIGVLLNQNEPTIFFSEESGKIYLDLVYSDGVYIID